MDENAGAAGVLEKCRGGGRISSQGRIKGLKSQAVQKSARQKTRRGLLLGIRFRAQCLQMQMEIQPKTKTQDTFPPLMWGKVIMIQE